MIKNNKLAIFYAFFSLNGLLRAIKFGNNLNKMTSFWIENGDNFKHTLLKTIRPINFGDKKLRVEIFVFWVDWLLYPYANCINHFQFL